jgi:glyoxylase-like metal-dependent hydrolase (beta-lactamase superfamily II)
MTFEGKLSVWLGKKVEVTIEQIGRGHTKGDTIAYLEDQKICFAGDLVSTRARPTAATATSATGRGRSTAFRPSATKLVPGRGAALETAAGVNEASSRRAPSSPTSFATSAPASPRARTCARPTRTSTPRCSRSTATG